MPGIQSTFLAMDTEEGVEVVWNELHFTDKKAFKAHEEKINTMFEQLVVVDHPNIVKLHKYWLDVKDSKARVRGCQDTGTGEVPQGGDASAYQKKILTPVLLLLPLPRGAPKSSCGACSVPWAVLRPGVQLLSPVSDRGPWVPNTGADPGDPSWAAGRAVLTPWGSG
uniref:Nuclear receptor binding protein 2 n=1 Tax=Chelydra serpentina TaxID=8475 RepID=A0A8C3S6N4_CHESE